jgi:hypothetical protein
MSAGSKESHTDLPYPTWKDRDATKLSHLCRDPRDWNGYELIMHACQIKQPKVTLGKCHEYHDCGPVEDWEDMADSDIVTCECWTQRDCVDFGGNWEAVYCDSLAEAYPNEVAAVLKGFQAAQDAATCDGIEIFMPHEDEPDYFAEQIMFPVESCCESSPASACEVNAAEEGILHMCSEDRFFMGDKSAAGVCEFEPHTAEDFKKCFETDDCHSDGEGFCDCQFEPGCEAVGGTWHSHATCSQLINRDFELKKLIKNLDCSNEEGNQYMQHMSKMCCSNSPGWICEPDKRPMHPCANSDDWVGSNSYGGYCMYEGQYSFYGQGWGEPVNCEGGAVGKQVTPHYTIEYCFLDEQKCKAKNGEWFGFGLRCQNVKEMIERWAPANAEHDHFGIGNLVENIKLASVGDTCIDEAAVDLFAANCCNDPAVYNPPFSLFGMTSDDDPKTSPSGNVCVAREYRRAGSG